jgi:hypothetical protein
MHSVHISLELTTGSAHPSRSLFSHGHLVAFGTCCGCSEPCCRRHILGVAPLFRRRGDGGYVGIHCNFSGEKTAGVPGDGHICCFMAEDNHKLDLMEICVKKGRFQGYVGILYCFSTSNAPRTTYLVYQ